MTETRETVWGNTTAQDVVIRLPDITVMVPKDSMRAIASEYDPYVVEQAPQLERLGDQVRPS